MSSFAQIHKKNVTYYILLLATSHLFNSVQNESSPLDIRKGLILEPVLSENSRAGHGRLIREWAHLHRSQNILFQNHFSSNSKQFQIHPISKLVGLLKSTSKCVGTSIVSIQASHSRLS